MIRAALPLLLLAGCAQEPDFDERYEATEAELRDKAAEMDAELEAAEAAAPTPAEPSPTP